ncbi:MAG: hypothetical protein ACRD4L_06200 [Pyrinomonadaceae bacterium]
MFIVSGEQKFQQERQAPEERNVADVAPPELEEWPFNIAINRSLLRS